MESPEAKISIRPFAPDDKPVIMEILKSLPQFTPDEVAIAEELIDIYLYRDTRSGYHLWTAEIDSVIAGYICYGPTPLTKGTWDIYWAAVAQKEQGKGVGGALWAFAENKIKEAGGRLIVIETSSKPHYERTRQFHRSQGYETVGRIPDFYAPGDDKLILQKSLSQPSSAVES